MGCSGFGGGSSVWVVVVLWEGRAFELYWFWGRVECLGCSGFGGSVQFALVDKVTRFLLEEYQLFIYL